MSCTRIPYPFWKPKVLYQQDLAYSIPFTSTITPIHRILIIVKLGIFFSALNLAAHLINQSVKQINKLTINVLPINYNYEHIVYRSHANYNLEKINRPSLT